MSDKHTSPKKDIYVDIDNTICRTEGMDYSDAIPIPKNIEYINELYDSNSYTITYWPARGVKTGISHIDLTIKQFKKWGVKYHFLKLTKPPFDLLIDDKAINSIWGWSPSAVNEVLSPGYNKSLLEESPTTPK
jgi:hypothetical protein